MPQPNFERFVTAELLADANHVVGVVDPAMTVRWISQSAAHYGLEAVGRPINAIIHPDDLQQAAQAFDGSVQLDGFEPSLLANSVVPIRLVTPTGVVPFEATGRWVGDGEDLWLIAILRDVSTRYAIDRGFRRLAAGCSEAESMQSIIAAAHEYGGVQGAQMVWGAGQARKTFGDLGAHPATMDDIWGDLTQIAAPGRAVQMSGSEWAVALPVQAADDSLGTLVIWGTGPEPDLDFTAAALVSLLDLAALSLKRSDELTELERQATTDQVTGLLNRHAFFAMLDRLINQSAVMYIDLDEFKVINDRFGHTLGDRLLSVVSRRLTDALSPGDVVGRIGGDEFAVLCRSSSPAQVRATGQRVVEALNQTFVIDGHRIATGASVGIAYSESAIGGRPLLDQADQALLEAKAQGKGRSVVVSTFAT